MQGGASGDWQERLPKCLLRERKGARRAYPSGQAPLGHWRTRRVRERGPMIPRQQGRDFWCHFSRVQASTLLCKQPKMKHESKKKCGCIISAHNFGIFSCCCVFNYARASRFCPKSRPLQRGAKLPPAPARRSAR